jgi:hypothetical protein
MTKEKSRLKSDLENASQAMDPPAGSPPASGPPTPAQTVPFGNNGDSGAQPDVQTTRSRGRKATPSPDAASMLRCYNLPDYRLEHPDFDIRQTAAEDEVPGPETTPLNVYCDGCNDIQLKEGAPRARAGQEAGGSKDKAAGERLK